MSAARKLAARNAVADALRERDPYPGLQPDPLVDPRGIFNHPSLNRRTRSAHFLRRFGPGPGQLP